LLITGIKSGETGWRRALLKRVASAGLPDWAESADLVTSAPPSPLHKWLRGFDLAEEAARAISGILNRPYMRTLSKAWFSGRQAKRPENRRRKMPQKYFCLSKGAKVAGKIILLIDDVWTTGTTLMRCAQMLKKAGAVEVRVLSLFRAI
jgi:predicted amidophosphoribosyltransferase